MSILAVKASALSFPLRVLAALAVIIIMPLFCAFAVFFPEKAKALFRRHATYKTATSAIQSAVDELRDLADREWAESERQDAIRIAADNASFAAYEASNKAQATADRFAALLEG